MPQQGYSIGRDNTLVFILPTGLTLRLRKVINFNPKQDTADQRIIAMDGSVDHLRFYQGWTATFGAERRGPEIDAYFAQLEANYYAGIDEPPATCQQTIQEPDGSITQWRYERVLMKFDDSGSWAGDKSVSQAYSFMAARRIRQA